MTEEKRIFVTIPVTPSVRQKIKSMAAEDDTKMYLLVKDLVEREYDRRGRYQYVPQVRPQK